MNLGPVGHRISSKLRASLAPDFLEVIDESQQHHGHAGARPEGESHFRVRIVAKVFAGKPRVEQHRMVNGALTEELRAGIHALAIESSAPA